MLLDLVRHGEALVAGSGGDRERPLSPAGIDAVRWLAERLRASEWPPERAYSSPYRRARETLAIVLGQDGGVPAAEELSELAPDTDPAEAIEAIAGAAGEASHALVVAHQPLLGRIVERLSGVRQGLAPGTLVRIECEIGLAPGSGRIRMVLAAEGG